MLVPPFLLVVDILKPLAPMSHRGGTPLIPSPGWTVLATFKSFILILSRTF